MRREIDDNTVDWVSSSQKDRQETQEGAARKGTELMTEKRVGMRSSSGIRQGCWFTVEANLSLFCTRVKAMPIARCNPWPIADAIPVRQGFGNSWISCGTSRHVLPTLKPVVILLGVPEQKSCCRFGTGRRPLWLG